MPLRTSPREIKTEVKIEEEEQEEEIEGEEVNEDEDLPPPILEREESCGENEDTDGDNKEEEDESVTGPSTKKNGKPREKELEEVEEEDEEKQKNLMEALAHVFSADGDSLGKKRALVSPVSAPKPVVLHRGRGRPPLSASNASPSASSFKFAPLRVPVSGGPSTSTDGRRNYGPPPPMPRVLRNQATPSNTSLLENRKRTTMAVDKNGIVVKRASLEAYNGGRAGEKFRSLQPTSTSPGTSTSSVEQMLREQSPVRIQVTAGGQDNTMQEALELAAQQRETIGQVAKASTNHSFLLGSLIMNGLNTLRDRNQDDYQNFSADLFALITKYRLQ
uniref:Uncharacterized protein n=1 Tax=Caenorhabditis japonica TaxID=281687 RepID=A0A8R1DIN8_CAEJA